MGEREIIQLLSSSSASDERDEGGGGGGEGEEEEEEEDCMLSTNNTNKDENKEEDKREKSIRGGVGRGPSYSNCSFPMSRIKRLMKNEGVIHFRTTPEFVFLINKATEQFLELFAEDAYACAVRERKKSLNYEHLYRDGGGFGSGFGASEDGIDESNGPFPFLFPPSILGVVSIASLLLLHLDQGTLCLLCMVIQ